jgi:hypothetical protein
VKKNTSKKAVAKSAASKAKNFKNFQEWWDKIAQKKVEKIERQWIKENEPNAPDDDEGGDHWCVNRMMHDGDAFNMTYEKAEEVWVLTAAGEPWHMSQEDSLYCDLDSVIMEAHEAAKSISKKGK